MTEKINYEQAAFILTGGKPMDIKAYQDGTLVVIAHNGKKFRFTAEQVENIQPKPDPKPKTTPKPKRGRPVKTESNSNKGR